MNGNGKILNLQEACQIRKMPSHGNNYNMYVGSSEYKMNKYLQFQTIQTEERFINYIMSRFKMLRNAMSYISIIVFSFIACFSWKKLFILLFFFPSMIFIIISNRMNLSRTMTRFIFAIKELLFFLVLKDEDNLIHSLSISLLIDYIYNISICFPWYYNFVIHSMIIGFYFYIKSTSSLLIDFVIYSIAIVSYGFFERVIKETWVLFDSFKKSEHNYRIILDNTEEPFMIINSHLKFEYINKSGTKTIFQNLKQQFNNNIHNRKITAYASPLHKQKLYQSFIKCVKNNENLKTQILFKFSDLNSREGDVNIKEEKSFYSSHSEVHEPDIDNEILSNNYQLFKCDMKKAAWKQQSNMILVRIKEVTQKFIKNQIKNKKKRYFIYGKEQENELLHQYEINKTEEYLEIDPLYNSFFYFPNQEEMKAFNISEFLYVILNSCYYSSKWKNINIIYKKNCNCPNEVVGKFKCLAFILSSLLKYFVSYSSDKTLNFDYSFIDLQNEKYELKFVLNCEDFPKDNNKIIHEILKIRLKDLKETFKLMKDHESINLILCKKYAEKYLNGSLIHSFKEEENYFEIILHIKLNRMNDSSQIEHFKINNKFLKIGQELNIIWDKNHELIQKNIQKDKRHTLNRGMTVSQTSEKIIQSDLIEKLKAIYNKDLNDKNTKKNEEIAQLSKNK